MPGLPNRARASLSASTQNPAVSVFDSPPGQHPSGCPVDDRDQVQKPLLHGDVGDVSGPHLVWLVDRLAAQKVIDDLHRKIGQLQVERDFLAGQPAISRFLRGGR